MLPPWGRQRRRAAACRRQGPSSTCPGVLPALALGAAAEASGSEKPTQDRHSQPNQRGKTLGHSPAAVLGALQHGSPPEALACQQQILFLNLPVLP